MRLDSLANELGIATSIIETDVANKAQATALFDQVRARFGGLDLLFNNAGLGINARFEASDPNDWRQMIDVKLYGVLHCTQAAIPPGRKICSVSSVGGRYGVESWSVYSATKFAVVGFHDALRKELGPDRIRVSVIEPGAVWTEFEQNVSQALDDGVPSSKHWQPKMSPKHSSTLLLNPPMYWLKKSFCVLYCKSHLNCGRCCWQSGRQGTNLGGAAMVSVIRVGLSTSSAPSVLPL